MTTGNLGDTTPVPGLDAEGRVDWSQVSEDIHCPLCRYNLRGLTEPRCPECGFRFTWPEVLDPRLRKHPFLFEHHPERNVGAFLRTVRATWDATRFWAELHPAQPSSPRRLMLYALLCLLPCVVAFSLHLNTWVQEEMRWSGSASWNRLLLRLCTRSWFLGCVLLPLLWPWLILVSLLVFQISMARARVAGHHVLRCVVYSYDSIFWIGCVLLGVELLRMVQFVPSKLANAVWNDMGMLLYAGVFLIAYGRLIVAYRQYLRFDRPIATTLSAQLIALLIMVNLWAFLNLWL